MKKFALLITLISIPLFSLMLRPGIYTMHDFHVFRQFEFDKCMSEGTFPCRWAADSSLGYGQPLFNFYGQFSYWLGTVFRSLNFSVLDSVKGVFILSIIASGVSMYVLARKYWGNWGGLVSSVLYMYAPYRAVDVWVRGALPEALGFVLFPLIWLSADNYVDTGKNRYLFWLIISFSALIITHNLSALMLVPFLGIWILFRLWKKLSGPKVEGLICAVLITFLLCAFYLLPIIFESRLVALGEIAHGYYDFGLHFVSLKQLFWSNFWGYGGSIWGVNDGLSFAVGYLHWVLPIVLGVWLVLSRRSKQNVGWLVITALGFLALFLTHGKSDLLWKIIPPLKYLQFPWRFLSLAVFLLALSSGVFAKLVNRWMIVAMIVVVILLNFSFFRPDIWLDVNDGQYFSSASWDQQRSSAISDYWPNTSTKVPDDFAPQLPQFVIGNGLVKEISKGAHKASYEVKVNTDYAKLVFPIVYFPAWTSSLGPVSSSGDLNLVTLRPTRGTHIVNLVFKDTPVRSLGNWISGLTLFGLVIWRWRYAQK